MTTSTYILVMATLILMSAYFSATETAFTSINKTRLRTMAEKGNKKADLVLKLSEKYDSLISTVLIGNNIVNIGLSSVATVFFIGFNKVYGALIATVVITVLVLIFGEVSPKSIAKESPEKFAMFSAPLLNILMVVLTPVNFLFVQWKKLLSMIVKVSDEKGITEEELLTIVEEAEQGGGIDKEESTLIRSAIEFNELEAVDIFTPRIDVISVSVDMTKDEIAKVFKETGFSRLPVYDGDIDHIVGILYQKDFHNYIYHTDAEIRDNLRPVVYITKNKRIDDLMKELQQKKLHFAVIVDEFGSMFGIVTLEDILEELVGEIWDEHDEIVHEIEQLSEHEYMVSGKANVEKLFDTLDKKMEVEVLTVNGWIMEMLGKIPAEGDFFESQGLEVKVEKMAGKRVEKVHIVCKEEIA